MMGEETMGEKLVKHDIQLGYITENIGGINSTLKEMMEMQKEVLVIMERQTNHEENVRDGFIHIHNRLNEYIQEEKERIKVHGEYCDLVEHNANKGAMAYGIVKWCGITVGALLIGSMFTMYLHALKVWG